MEVLSVLSLLKKIIFILIIYILWVCLSCNMEGKTFSFKCLEKNIKSFIKTFQRKMRLISYRESFETSPSYIPENENITDLGATQINTYVYLKTKYEAALSQAGLTWEPDWKNKEWKLDTVYDRGFFEMDSMFEEYILYTVKDIGGNEIKIATNASGEVIEAKSGSFKRKETYGDPKPDDVAYEFMVTNVGLGTFTIFEAVQPTDSRLNQGLINNLSIAQATFAWYAREIQYPVGVRYGKVDMDTYIQDFLACLVNEIDVLNKYVNHLQKVNRMGDDMI